MGPALGRPDDKLRDQAIEAIEQRGCLLRCKTEAGPFSDDGEIKSAEPT
jgi:hypothetical protein